MYSQIVHFDTIASEDCPFYAWIGLQTSDDNRKLGGSVRRMYTVYATLYRYTPTLHLPVGKAESEQR